VEKIFRINLSINAINSIETAQYEEFGGGLGIGTGISEDLAAAPGKWSIQVQ
jgi:hypothetical protein